MKHLSYAAIKAVQLPKTWDLPIGRHRVNTTIHLQGEIVVGHPTFYTEPLPHKVETIIAVCGLLRLTKKKASDLYHALQYLSSDDKEEYDIVYGSLLREYENTLKTTKQRKERKGSITGSITVEER